MIHLAYKEMIYKKLAQNLLQNLNLKQIVEKCERVEVYRSKIQQSFSKPANLMLGRSYVTWCCINYSRKLLSSAIRIDHFLDTRANKVQARNYTVVTSLQL